MTPSWLASNFHKVAICWKSKLKSWKTIQLVHTNTSSVRCVNRDTTTIIGENSWCDFFSGKRTVMLMVLRQTWESKLWCEMTRCFSGQTPPPFRLPVIYLPLVVCSAEVYTSERKEQQLMNKTLNQLGCSNTVSNWPYINWCRIFWKSTIYYQCSNGANPRLMCLSQLRTPLKTNISPEIWCLEDDTSFWTGPFSGASC